MTDQPVAAHGVHQLGVDDESGAQQADVGATEEGRAAAEEPSSGVLEIATIEVAPGAEDAFLASYRAARSVLADTDGCRSVRMTRGVESPSRFVLLVEWDSVQAHEANFRATDRFTQWRGHIGPHFASPPHIEHYTDVDD